MTRTRSGNRGLGEVEQLVLLAILRLGDEAYGVPIAEEIEVRTGRSVSRTNAYIALMRLEKRGLVTSRLGNPTPERGGKAKRYFQVRPEGIERLRRAKAVLVSMWEGLEPVLE